MPTPTETFMALLHEGKVKEAQALLEAEKANLKFFPDTVEAVKGKQPRFTKKGKRVEIGEDGKWRPREKKK